MGKMLDKYKNVSSADFKEEGLLRNKRDVSTSLDMTRQEVGLTRQEVGLTGRWDLWIRDNKGDVSTSLDMTRQECCLTREVVSVGLTRVGSGRNDGKVGFVDKG